MDRFGVALAAAKPENVIVDGDFRITVITDRILRLEHVVGGKFEDRPSQSVVCRNFANPQFKYTKTKDEVRIVTAKKEFFVNKHTANVLVKKGDGWRDARHGVNRKGTARTLDFSFGWIKFDTLFVRMGDGLFSTSGVAEIDDSHSLLLNADGTVSPREYGVTDKYVFAFDDDYLGGLKEFYGLTGFTPIIPKYALGNWWSRYHAYTQKEYLDLMDEFEKKDVPLTVATIDMDWHLVKDVPKDLDFKSWQGRGWTGYTFNEKLFPDYKDMFRRLKDKGLAITMNLHPRDGVRYFEKQYPEMARANGIDPATKKQVEFDFTSLSYINSYFDILHHPYEEDGVDFWWIDWQQGTKSKLKNFDPLWALNHYHTLDAGRDGRTALVLSRYAGVGSHRYPLGFSGDTSVTWASLKIQPYFTATASNVGYTWWSHDIGGHLFGRGNAELYTRWVQYGVFSPINRLHSNNKSWSKEPWLYGDEAEKIATDFLRLRHRLLPYLYTANVATAKDGVPLIMPIYYLDKSKNGYKAKDEYFFGSEMLVAPVITPMKRGEKFSRTKVYLPKGVWTDFFTGERYDGGKIYEIKSPLERIPVFVKEGGIVPMIAERKGNSQSFDNLEVRVYEGKNRYEMRDDDGSGILFENNGNTLTITPVDNRKRTEIEIVFIPRDGNARTYSVTLDGAPVSVNLVV